MGAGNDSGARFVTGTGGPPGRDEFEVTLFGPGYGESIAIHMGDGAWVLVDSCLDGDGAPRSLRYLESMGIDPAQDVLLVVATHWHDDHIRGMAQMVEACGKAAFCCASVLCTEEFLAAVAALEGRRLSVAGSGFQEIHGVFSRLRQSGSQPVLAISNRLIHVRDRCEIWSLSPNDSNFLEFLKTVKGLLPEEGKSKRRISSLSPNGVAVALWIRIGEVAILLGSDLERRGWIDILQGMTRPTGTASVFKVPHHGSENAHEQGVWDRMLDPDPFALLTPWRRGGSALPSQRDVKRVLSCTKNAYATARFDSQGTARVGRSGVVDRTIRESGIQLRRLAMSPGAIRLRRPPGSQASWKIEQFGSACHLADFASQ